MISAKSAIESFHNAAEKFSENLQVGVVVSLRDSDVIEPCEADFFEACEKFCKGEIDDIPSYMRQQDEKIKEKTVKVKE